MKDVLESAPCQLPRKARDVSLAHSRTRKSGRKKSDDGLQTEVCDTASCDEKRPIISQHL